MLELKIFQWDWVDEQLVLLFENVLDFSSHSLNWLIFCFHSCQQLLGAEGGRMDCLNTVPNARPGSDPGANSTASFLSERVEKRLRTTVNLTPGLVEVRTFRNLTA